MSPANSARRLDAPPDYLARYARFTPAQVWQNLNMSPDFPTVSRLIADLYPQSGGTALDGVVAVDPFGLRALLQLTGPVVVPNWPVPITADNVVDVTLRQEYEVFADRGLRENFLGDVAKGAVPVLLAATPALAGPQVNPWVVVASALAAILGHAYSLWFYLRERRFSRGKAVACQIRRKTTHQAKKAKTATSPRPW